MLEQGLKPKARVQYYRALSQPSVFDLSPTQAAVASHPGAVTQVLALLLAWLECWAWIQ